MKNKKLQIIFKESLNYVKSNIYKIIDNSCKIYNLYNYFLGNYLVKIKKYEKLNLPNNVPNGFFEMFIITLKNKKEILKIPKRNNFWNYSFYLKLRKKKEFENYCNILNSLKNIPYLKEHIINFVKINRNGGYRSDYIEGENLKIIRNKILYENINYDPKLCLKVVFQIKKLIKHIEKYNKKIGPLFGDWPIHNLMYDKKEDRIINVDLEGFYTYNENKCVDSLVKNVDYIKRQLNELVNLLDENYREDQKKISKVLDTIRYTSVRNEAYNAKNFESAYHSIKLNGKFFKGQRGCKLRFKNLNYNFKDKSVLDFGCNIGGMLHYSSNKIKCGVGIDFCPKCINAANMIKDLNQEKNVNFYNFDLEKENLENIKNFVHSKKVDICFLLSVCMWIKNWKEVISFCSNLAKDLLFETNGSKKQQQEQINFLKEKYSKIVSLDKQSLDDPLQKNRKLYLCRN